MNKIYHKVILILLIIILTALGIYLKFFKRPPLDQILAANLANTDIDVELYDYIDDRTAGHEPNVNEYLRSKIRWEIWVRAMNYISIGTLYDTCNETNQITLGKVILLEDPLGGLTTKTFLNTTFVKDITAGRIYMACQFNSNDLYSQDWDLCSIEDDDKYEDRIINCPVRKGKRRFVKNLKIPNYLPKGHFKAKAWLTDQNNDEVGCGFAEFTI